MSGRVLPVDEAGRIPPRAGGPPLSSLSGACDEWSDLTAAIASRQARCGVIGLGFIGSTLADALAVAGFDVVGYDRAPAAVERYASANAGDDRVPGVAVTGDPVGLEGSSVVFVAVRLLPQPGGTFDFGPLRSAAETVAALRPAPSLVLVSSTVPPGTTREFAGWVRERAGAADGHTGGEDERSGPLVAHAPERLSAGHDWRTLKALPHLVGGLTEAATALGWHVLSAVCDEVHAVPSPEVSELSKLLENAFLSVGIGLVGEVSAMAQRLGVSAQDVCEAAATKRSGYFPFYPGAGVGGHCLPNDLLMLEHTGVEAGIRPELLEATRRVLGEQPRLAVERLAALLSAHGLELERARVLVVGVGFKPGSADTTASPAKGVVRALRRRGAAVAYVDERVDGFCVDDVGVPRVRRSELGRAPFDAALVVAGESTVGGEELLSAAPLVLDASGGRALRGWGDGGKQHFRL